MASRALCRRHDRASGFRAGNCMERGARLGVVRLPGRAGGRIALPSLGAARGARGRGAVRAAVDLGGDGGGRVGSACRPKHKRVPPPPRGGRTLSARAGSRPPLPCRAADPRVLRGRADLARAGAVSLGRTRLFDAVPAARRVARRAAEAGGTRGALDGGDRPSLPRCGGECGAARLAASGLRGAASASPTGGTAARSRTGWGRGLPSPACATIRASSGSPRPLQASRGGTCSCWRHGRTKPRGWRRPSPHSRRCRRRRSKPTDGRSARCLCSAERISAA